MKKYTEKKRSFNCDNDLWEEFGVVVEKDKSFKNRSEAIRFLIRKYIKEERLKEK